MCVEKNIYNNRLWTISIVEIEKMSIETFECKMRIMSI